MNVRFGAAAEAFRLRGSCCPRCAGQAVAAPTEFEQGADAPALEGDRPGAFAGACPVKTTGDGVWEGRLTAGVVPFQPATFVAAVAACTLGCDESL